MVVLVAFCSATGPAFADMGYDLEGRLAAAQGRLVPADYARYDIEGKREQFKSSLIPASWSPPCAWRCSGRPTSRGGQIPPVSKVYADTIAAGLTNPHTLQNMLIWAIPGA